MIVECKAGGKLYLSKTKLRELTGEAFKGAKYYMLLADFKKAYEMPEPDISWSVPREVLIHLPKPVSNLNSHPKVDLDIKKRRIGCRRFTLATFAKILEAAGIKPVRKTKSRRKK